MENAGRCYDCFRPRAACFCPAIPRIDNRTELLIVQHWRERFHPFNTARIVHKALCNSHLLADHTPNLARRLRLAPRAALLYPGPSALSISELPAGQRPDQLVVLDGTWHHAKTLIRDIPALRALPRYRLAPAAPSRYRIRREPSAAALSTVEAAVAALRILEPDTAGLDQLLQAFDTMVEHQLAHPGSVTGQRYRQRRRRTVGNIPLALLGDLGNIVVAYGESPPGQQGCLRTAGPPIVWVAQRLTNNDTFSCTLTPPSTLDEVFLGHLGLGQRDFAAAISIDAARRRWRAFLRPDDIVVVYHPGTARLCSHLADEGAACLVLKSVALESTLRQQSLDGLLASQGIPVPRQQLPGRAGQRLAQTIALVRHLRALGNALDESIPQHGCFR
jgi:DTW domain-containing protein